MRKTAPREAVASNEPPRTGSHVKLVMTLLIRDEADILTSNLAFHADRGVDHFIIMDNRSEDATRDLIAPFEALGLATYIYQSRDDYDQHTWVTGMARRAYLEFGADWVINNDADEFWWPHTGDLKAALDQVDPGAEAAHVERTNFLPPPPGTLGSFWDSMIVRDARSVNSLGQPLPGKVCHRGAADISVAQGNHAISRDGRQIPAVPAPITILHYPARSYAQFANKIAKGGAAYARNTALAPHVGGTWRNLFELLKQDALRPHFDALRPKDAQLNAALAAGRLIRDTRLRDALRELDTRQDAASMPL